MPLWVSAGVMIVILGGIVLLTVRIVRLLPVRETYASHPLPTLEEQVAGCLQRGRAAFLQMNDLEKALRCFEDAIALDPKNPQAWDAAGQILLLLNKKEQAGEYLKRAYQLNPKNPQIILDYAIANLQNDRAQEALALVDSEALGAQQRSSFEFNLVRACIYVRLRNMDLAKVFLQKAINQGSLAQVKRLTRRRLWAQCLQPLLERTETAAPGSSPSPANEPPQLR